MQDYLKAVYKLQGVGRPVTTTGLAARLGVKPPSVTRMLKHLARLRLVAYHRYHGVELTPAGQKIALEIVRHHRLVELYLAQALSLPLDRVHDEAERLEHTISEDLEDQIDRVLGHPRSDPHGDPIPGRDGTVEGPGVRPLQDVPAGHAAVVVRISDEDASVLRHLVEHGIVPGARVHVLEALPFGGPLRLRVDGVEHLLGRPAAGAVFVAEEAPVP